MGNNTAFLTLHDKNYEEGSYLYHYTGMKSAACILYYNTLRFSSIGKNLNDCVEPKNKIRFEKYSPLNEPIVDFFRKTINQHIRICCLAEDETLQERYGKTDDKYFTDYSGRGCCLPKMWSYYGADNKGVCFIINKEKLASIIQKKYPYMLAEPVKYVRTFPHFVFTEEIVEQFTSKIVMDNEKTCDWLPEFFLQYPECVRNNYFAKNTNWREEHEYRFMIYTPNANEIVEIRSFSSFLEGIVIGEEFDEVDLKMFKAVVPRAVPIKRVVFQHDKTILK